MCYKRLDLRAVLISAAGRTRLHTGSGSCGSLMALMGKSQTV